MTEPLVSIMMITYNHAPFIVQAIEGVLQQKTNFFFELVIGEDCSTDGTREIVFEYQKKYPDTIRVITSDENVGMKKNGYRTTKACRGKYLAYCEGDDYWHRDDRLQIQVDYLEGHPECGLVCSDYDYLIIKGMQKISNYRKSFYSYLGKTIIESPQINDILTENVGIMTCTIVARKNLVWQVIEADPYLHQSEHFKMGDTQLWAEISVISKVHYFDESFATRQILEESATQSKDRQKRLRFLVSDAEMYLYLCDKYGLPKDIKELHEKNWRRSSLQLAFFTESRDLAETVREKYPKLSLKDWVWYVGAKYSFIRPFVVLIDNSYHFAIKQ